ncbi:MAG: hypothetical protein M3Z08_07415 [Chloroflexota bacterium]|nr:hypothetical protein [Chloroflexota bacterium]
MDNLEVRIEDLSGDMQASFKQLSAYLGTFEDRFDTVEKDIGAIKGDISDIRATMATKDDIVAIQGDISNIKATMATKDDISNIKATMATKDDIVYILRDINKIREGTEILNRNILLLFSQILEHLPKSQ